MKYLVEMSIKKLNEIAEWIEISRLQKLDARFESKFHEQVESWIKILTQSSIEMRVSIHQGINKTFGGNNTPPQICSPLIWTYPDGARQLRRSAPRRRAPSYTLDIMFILPLLYCPSSQKITLLENALYWPQKSNTVHTGFPLRECTSVLSGALL